MPLLMPDLKVHLNRHLEDLLEHQTMVQIPMLPL